MKNFRIFLSSPGDVATERARARELLLGLARGPFVRGRVHIDVVSWDDPLGAATMDARYTPQEAVNRGLPKPENCDLTVVLLWGRMGTPLTETRADGSQYLSGTEWEFENALAANKALLVYRRSEKVQVDLDDPEIEEKLTQKRRVDAFFERFKGEGGALLRGHATYNTATDLIDRLRQDVEGYLSKLPNEDDDAGAPSEKRVPFMADPLPDGFVARPEEYQVLKNALLGPQRGAVVMLRGAGGYGKTVLANALCYDSEIQSAFPDGILRVTLGQKPDDLVGRIADLIWIISGSMPSVRSIDAAKVALADALDDRRCLLVIDDAWRVEDLAPFLYSGPGSQTTRLVTTRDDPGPRNQTTRLVTSRDDRVLSRNVTRIAVDAMKPSEAQELLCLGIPTSSAIALRSYLPSLAARLGEWPLLLGLANGVIKARILRGASAMDALEYAELALAKRGISDISPVRPDRESRRRTAWGALEISLEQLQPDERTRFAELAVFVEDAEIPVSVALGLWQRVAGLHPLDGQELLELLAGLSLLLSLDLGRGVIRLHDVVRTMLREKLITGRTAELDRRLVEHFSDSTDGDLTTLTDTYGLRHLLTHLVDAGDIEAAFALLADPRWISNKLQKLGIQPVLHDYHTLPHDGGSLDLIRAALMLAAPALARNPGELASQLLARLAPSDAAGLTDFLAGVRNILSPPAFVTAHPTFTPPGAELLIWRATKTGSPVRSS